MPEIDGLRAIAILSVIINHFDKKLLLYGYLGVDIFFVISGYVITNSLVSRNYKNFNKFIFGFYSRRIKRIIPTLAFYVIAISLTAALLGISNSNLSFFRTAIDYFSDSIHISKLKINSGL